MNTIDTGWPPGFPACYVKGDYSNIAGEAIAGGEAFIRITASPAAILDTREGTTIVTTTYEIQLTSNGRIGVRLPGTDDPDLNPTDFTYLIEEQFPNGRSFSIEAPMNTTVDLTLVAPVPASDGTTIVRGPIGPAGPANGVSPIIYDGDSGDISLDTPALKTILNSTYVPQISPATSYTWDEATGSIATITEHYPSPIGDKITTYGAYNAAGDPTTETDPDGSQWLLGYDSDGNLTSRTAA